MKNVFQHHICIAFKCIYIIDIFSKGNLYLLMLNNCLNDFNRVQRILKVGKIVVQYTTYLPLLWIKRLPWYTKYQCCQKYIETKIY